MASGGFSVSDFSSPTTNRDDRHDEQCQRIVQRILFCPSQERTARELYSMDKQQRQQVWADMTGHAATIDYRMHSESPELIRDRLILLDKELLKHQHQQQQQPHNDDKQQQPKTTTAVLSMDGCEAYRRALEQDADWVQEQKLKFLRADDFDPVAAAARMVHYFAVKAQLFGNDQILGRDITQSDLSADDQEALFAGGMQFLSERDHAGRGVIFTRSLNYKYKERENQLRACLYTGQLAAKDEVSQKVGHVCVSYNVGTYPGGGYDFELTRRVSQLVKAMPVRFCSIYFCFSSTTWMPVADLIGHLVSPFLRVRLRSIQGSSHQECLYQLLALGIPISTIPLTQEGENRLDNHVAFLKLQKINEQQQQSLKDDAEKDMTTS